MVRVSGGGAINVTVSVGAATMSGAAADVSGLVAAADAALYAAKEAGKNRVVAAPSKRSSKGRPQAVPKGRQRASRR